MIFKSIRWRILAWNFALLSVVVVVLLTAFLKHERASRFMSVESNLRQAMFATMPLLHETVPGLDEHRPPPYRPGRPPAPPPRPLSIREEARMKELNEGAIWCVARASDGRDAFRSANAPSGYAPEIAPPNREDPSAMLCRRVDRNMIIEHRTPAGFVIGFGTSTIPTESEIDRITLAVSGIGALTILLGCSIGWWLAGRSLRPIGRMSVAAERIASGRYEHRLDTAETESELGRLAVVLNDSFEKMNAAREKVVRFTADASHELRTPLTIILSEGQRALRRDRTPEEYRETLATIDRAARRMKAISDALLELASADSGNRPVEATPCDLADLADETLALVEPLAKEHGALIRSSLDSCPVSGDAARLGRLILNLVSNALLHNPPGVAITVATRTEGDRAVLEVSDNGTGIPAAHRDKIFDRFHRADASRSRHTGGAGLGLAIVRQTVLAHGGSITLADTPGGGATFRVTLPVHAS